ncbi:MAG: hypothetical protein LBE82_06910, partial [Chitinophagaceae bacterium]|nr:hypothetical protein [Chitinophagaceae bacterium]
MADTISLIKSNPLLPAEDYVALRKQGFKGIEQLGSAIWTDYNTSDPGITILEAVCYAITDLAYRNGFEIKDLLAPEELTPDTWNEIFYTARKILHNNPLTQDDYRKMIIDIAGVRNAWIQPSKDYEVPVWIDYSIEQMRPNNDCQCKDKEEKKCIGQLGLNPTTDMSQCKIVEFEGLYNVMVEYEEDILEEGQRENVRQQVIERLAQHRNLCEDFLSVSAVQYEDFGIGAAIVLEEHADADEVLAQLFFTIYRYFTPSIPFYTIQQMMDKGYQADDIFNGPALKHGFIDTVDLDKTDLFRDIHLSDIIAAVASIPGIKAITYLHLPFLGFDKETSSFYFNQWIKFLKNEQKIARIQPSMSQIMFCKERDFITYNTGGDKDRKPARVLKLFRDLKAAERKYKLQGADNDFPVPTGENMALEDYYPITCSLPECYGVNDKAGLPAGADDTRKTQALQLKGYLLFFEQILADHLVQLNHLRDLFSFDNEVTQTYFTRTLTETEDLQSLLIDSTNQGADHFDLILKNFAGVLQNIAETPELFHERRNRFLNHLLARFGEDFSEYETISRWLTPYKINERMIRDKIAMLKNGEYHKISANRGKAYNYTRTDVWDTHNVSGAERRISRLLGFSNTRRRNLAPATVVTEPVMTVDAKNAPIPKTDKAGNSLNVVKLLDPSDGKTVLFTSVEVKEGCCTEELIYDILEHADDVKYYKFHDELKQRSRKSAGLIGSFWFELYDDTDPEVAVLLGKSETFDKKETRDAAFKQLQKLMLQINENEGLHLIEHILLRPKFDEMDDEAGANITVKFLDICLDNCDRGIGVNEGTQIPPYRTKTSRVAASKCYDAMPWVLEFMRYNTNVEGNYQSFLFQQVFTDGTPNKPLKFRKYEDLSKRLSDIHEFGSERINYEIVSNGTTDSTQPKYSFILHGNNGETLAQSLFMFNKSTDGSNPVTDDIEVEIQNFMDYCGFKLDLYCEPDPCDNNEDPYSFRTTIVLP